MSYRADPRFLPELKRYGAVNIEDCFNCGNCSAVCPLSTGEDSFPRRMIRYAQLGMRDRLLNSKELWLCYFCGECTATCPRQADPGELMAAARRYAIAGYDRLGLARRLYTSPLFSVVFLTALAIALGLFIYAFHGPMPGGSLGLFAFIPVEVVHSAGVGAGLVILVTTLLGAATMAVRLGRAARPTEDARPNRPVALWQALVEALSQRRYRQDCETYAPAQPWYAQKWLAHAAILWGFLGLFLATASDYLLALLGIKPTGTWVPIWYPVRLLGTLAGLALVYGVTAVILKRLRKEDEAYRHSTPSDWAFLAFLWLAGVTGFALEIAVYLPQPHAWSYWMLLAHLVVVLELLILLPFGKFSHAVYRTVALYYNLAHQPKE